MDPSLPAVPGMPPILRRAYGYLFAHSEASIVADDVADAMAWGDSMPPGGPSTPRPPPALHWQSPRPAVNVSMLSGRELKVTTDGGLSPRTLLALRGVGSFRTAKPSAPMVGATSPRRSGEAGGARASPRASHAGDCHVTHVPVGSLRDLGVCSTPSKPRSLLPSPRGCVGGDGPGPSQNWMDDGPYMAKCAHLQTAMRDHRSELHRLTVELLMSPKSSSVDPALVERAVSVRAAISSEEAELEVIACELGRNFKSAVRALQGS